MWSTPPPPLCQNPHAGNTLPPPTPRVTSPSRARDSPRRPFLLERQQHQPLERPHPAARLALDHSLGVLQFRPCSRLPDPLALPIALMRAHLQRLLSAHPLSV